MTHRATAEKMVDMSPILFADAGVLKIPLDFVTLGIPLAIIIDHFVFVHKHEEAGRLNVQEIARKW